MTVNDAALEAAAEGFYMSGPGGSEKHWDDLQSARKAHFRSRARIALEAAAQHMLAELRSELASLAREFDAAAGGTLAYTTTDGRFQMRKNAHDQLMHVIDSRSQA